MEERQRLEDFLALLNLIEAETRRREEPLRRAVKAKQAELAPFVEELMRTALASKPPA